MITPSILADRGNYTKDRLEALRKKLAQSQVIQRYQDLAIYATGSYGRGEASQHSDLDLFMLDKSGDCGRIGKTLVTAELIEIASELGFPEFTNDGEYLEVHNLVV